MNEDMRHFIFSMLESGIETSKKSSTNPRLKNSGKLLSVSFLISKKDNSINTFENVKVKQRYRFTDYVGDSWLNEQEKKNIQQLLTFDMLKEMENCFHQFYTFDLKQQKIFSEKKFNDGEIKKTVI